MSKVVKPISIHTFPTNVHTNCFGFAIGDIESLDSLEASKKFNMDNTLPIAKAVLKKFRELGYELPRQISTVNEAHSNEIVLKFFDFTAYPVKTPFMGELDEPEIHWDFHVVRREVDGTWVHKPGWRKPPCAITKASDWEAIYEEFGRKYVLFAVAVHES